MQEELFGPVLALHECEDFSEALDILNNTDFALTAAVYSRSPLNIQKAKEACRVGNLYINHKSTGALVNRQPFGGFALSGTGPKAGGPGYLQQFCNQRHISENTMRRGFSPELES